MSISANYVGEVRVAGNDTNGGGFITGASGTDYSQQNTKNSGGADSSTTDAVAAGTTTITSATAAFGTTIVGNVIYLAGGTGSLTAGWYQVTARSNSTTITVDRNVATGTGITMNIGGALLSPAIAAAILNANNGGIIFLNYSASVYSITSASSNVAGGVITLPNTISSYLVGYNTTRTLTNTDTLRPTIQANVASVSMITQGLNNGCANLILDGNNKTSINGFGETASSNIIINCSGLNFTNGFINSGALYAIGCTATGCSSIAPFGSGLMIGCEAFANSVTGFSVNALCINCLSYNNTGASSDGFFDLSRDQFLVNCVAYGNGGNGFNSNGTVSAFIGCIAENNGGWGFTNAPITIGCSAYNNTSGNFQASQNPLSIGNKSPTSSVFINAGTLNFGLNNTANAGALLRAANVALNTFHHAATVGFTDIGAAQSQGGASFSGFFIA